MKMGMDNVLKKGLYGKWLNFLACCLMLFGAILIESRGKYLSNFFFHSAQNEFVPNFSETGLCFFLSGMIVFLRYFSSQTQKKSQIVLGLILVGITVHQFFFTILPDLKVSRLFNTFWFEHKGIIPGVMRPNIALVFFLTGLNFFIIKSSETRKVYFFSQLLILSIFILGLLDVFGYLLLGSEFVGYWAKKIPLDFLTAFFIVVLAIALLLFNRNQTGARFSEFSDYSQKVALITMAILLVVSLVAGLIGFSAIANQHKNYLSLFFQGFLTEHALTLEHQIEHASAELNASVKAPMFKKAIVSKDLSTLNSLAQLFLAEGFSSVKITNDKGEVLLIVGNFDVDGKKFPIQTFPEAVLIWDRSPRIQMDTAIYENNVFLGHLEIQWTLRPMMIPAVSSSHKNPINFLLCSSSILKNLNCIDSNRIERSLDVEKIEPNTLNLMMDSYNEQHIFFSYAPIGKTGLFVGYQIDLEEAFSPVEYAFKVFLPIFFLAVFMGLMLLYLEVIPLIKELVISRKLLKKSQARYSLAFRGSGAGLWDWNIKTGRMYLSPQMESLLGYDKGKFSGEFSEFQKQIHPLEQINCLEKFKKHLSSGEQFSVELRIRQQQGNYRWFRLRGKALKNRKGKAYRMLGSMVDVSEEKKTETRLIMQRQISRIFSEQQNAELAKIDFMKFVCEILNFPVSSIWLINKKSGFMECEKIWCQPDFEASAFLKITKELQCKTEMGLPGRVAKRDAPIWIEDLWEDPGFPRAPYAKSAGLKSGFAFPIRQHKKVIGIVEFFSSHFESADTHLMQMMDAIGNQFGQYLERKTIEEDLKNSESLKTAILDSAIDGILTFDKFGKLVTCNMNLLHMIGFEEGDAINQPIETMFPGLSEKIQALSEKPVIFETIAICPNKENFSVEISLSRLLLANKELYMAIVRDISERKRIERLKNEFVAMVSHELRTPLTSISGALTLLSSGMLGDFSGNAKNMLSVAEKNCQRLIRLINDILDIEKIEAGRIKLDNTKIDLDLLLLEVVSSHRAYVENLGVEVVLRSQENTFYVFADYDRLTQVCINLLSNAAKFSPKGGVVTVELSFYEDDWVRIAFSDQGEGIPPDFYERVFEKFAQADASSERRHSGTGLGLSICKAIVERLGGHVSFSSNQGKGTTFYVDLPRWHEQIA